MTDLRYHHSLGAYLLTRDGKVLQMVSRARYRVLYAAFFGG